MSFFCYEFINLEGHRFPSLTFNHKQPPPPKPTLTHRIPPPQSVQFIIFTQFSFVLKFAFLQTSGHTELGSTNKILTPYLPIGKTLCQKKQRGEGSRKFWQSPNWSYFFSFYICPSFTPHVQQTQENPGAALQTQLFINSFMNYVSHLLHKRCQTAYTVRAETK